MTEDQMYYGIIGVYILLVGPLVVGLFWMQHKKNQQDRAVSARLRKGRESREAEYTRMGDAYEQELERRTECFEDRCPDEEEL